MTNRNEGEGNRTAAREYNEATKRFVDSGKVPEKAEEALRAVEGSEKASLDAAERAGKSHAKGEDPQVRR
jgi:hypothetical protein